MLGVGKEESENLMSEALILSHPNTQVFSTLLLILSVKSGRVLIHS